MSSPPRKDFLKVKMGRNKSSFSRRISLSKRLQCDECERDFGTPATLRRHIFEQHARKTKLICPFCSKTFTRKHDLEKHSRKIHAEAEPILTEVEVPLVIKEDPDSDNPLPDGGSPPKKRVSFSLPLCRARQIVETPPASSDLPSPCSETERSFQERSFQERSFQDAEVQTTKETDGASRIGSSSGPSIGGEMRQRVIERTTKELLDDDGKVIARITTERFLVD